MASSFRLSIFLVMITIVVVGASNQFKVGENDGWHVPDKNNTRVYDEWAGKIRFRVGDSLYFEYKNDSVLVVNKRGYYHCITTNPIASFTDGKTTFVLDSADVYYFISGELDHCKNGQRLIVDVLHTPGSLTPISPSPSPVPSAAISCRIPSPRALAVLTTLMIMNWAHSGSSFLLFI